MGLNDREGGDETDDVNSPEASNFFESLLIAPESNQP